MISAEQLQEIKARCEATTPGPWMCIDDGFYGAIESESAFIFGGEPSEGRIDATDPNAIFTAHARTDVPRLLDSLDAEEAENARLREANGILEDALQEVGDDYPGSSCQQWCQHQVKAARAALSPNPDQQED